MEQIIYLLYRTTNIIGTAQHNFLGDSAIIIVIYPDAVPCRCSSCRSGARPRLCRTYVVPDLHPGISSIEGGIMIARGDEWGGGNGGAVIAPIIVVPLSILL